VRIKTSGPIKAIDPGGFTLLEMVAVLTLLAVLSGLVVVNYRGPVNQARLENLFEQVDALDARIRLRCRQENVPLQLWIDRDRGTFTVKWTQTAETVSIPTVRLGRGMTLGGIRTFGRPDVGDTMIPYSTRGVAPLWCYRVQLADGREFYRLMFGASGQSLTLEGKEQWETWERFIREREYEN